VRSVRGTIERQVYWRLTNSLTHEQMADLAKLLDVGPAKGSLLGWLRRVPRSCSAAGILDLIRRLLWVRGKTTFHRSASASWRRGAPAIA
jgi:hypothetical protein